MRSWKTTCAAMALLAVTGSPALAAIVFDPVNSSVSLSATTGWITLYQFCGSTDTFDAGNSSGAVSAANEPCMCSVTGDGCDMGSSTAEGTYTSSGGVSGQFTFADKTDPEDFNAGCAGGSGGSFSSTSASAVALFAVTGTGAAIRVRIAATGQEYGNASWTWSGSLDNGPPWTGGGSCSADGCTQRGEMNVDEVIVLAPGTHFLRVQGDFGTSGACVFVPAGIVSGDLSFELSEAAFCGNGVIDAEEACDDGGQSSLCDSDCTPAICGDSEPNPAAGELCDDGNVVDADGCDSNCTPTSCGNGVVTGAEECDDGNIDDADACANDCRQNILPSPTSTAAPTPEPTATPIPSEAPTAAPSPVGQPVAAPRKCRAALVTASAALIQAEAKAGSACHGKIVSGKLVRGTNCSTEPKAAAAIAKARAKHGAAIAKACGGRDRVCGSGGDDVTLVEIGWPTPGCPGIAGGGCTNATTDCAGIAACLACLGDAAVDRVIGLAYDQLVATDPKVRSEKALNTCQATLGQATTAFLVAKSKALAKCWDAVNDGRALGLCPGGSLYTLQLIAKASSKRDAAICKACGGADQKCDGAADFTATEIGFTASCPDVTGSGASSCAAPVSTAGEVLACGSCVTDFSVDCATLASVPLFALYPPECHP